MIESIVKRVMQRLKPSSCVRDPIRVILISTPRSGNTWLRRLLADILGLAEFAVHNPDDLDWDSLPPRCIVQLHWLPTEAFVSLLQQHGFQIVVLARHPLDVLASILHFAPHMERPFRWLEGLAGDESSLLDASPHSKALLAYATGPRFAALLSVSQLWWSRDGVVRIRYEDLVANPHAALEALCAAVGFKPGRGVIRKVLAANSMEAINQAFHKQHCWKGQPGAWKTILTETEANRIRAVRQDVFSELGYRGDPG